MACLQIASILLLLSLAKGCNAATGDVGQACLTGNTCTDSNAYCVTSTSLCACKPNFLQKGTVCGRIFNKPCGDGLCLDNGVCSSGSCTCDTSKKFAAGSSGDATCSCPSGYTLQSGVCKKTLDQSCSAVSECYTSTGIVCTGGKCQCDTANNFAAGTAGTTSCSCASGYSLQNGACKKTLDQSCSAASECYTSTGIVCTGGKCACDTANNFAAGTAGTTSCSCASGYSLQNGACKKTLDQSCSAASECYTSTGIVCTGGKCACDTANNFAAGTAGTTSCSCASGYSLQNGACKKTLDQSCSDATECYTSTGIVCTGGKCACDTANNFAAGTAGTTSCSSCASGYSLQNGACKKTLDQSCSAATECYTSTGIVCTGGKCACDTANNFAAGTAGTTSCSSCASGYSLQNGACKKTLDQSCSAVSECYSSTGIVCTGGKCQCDTANHFAAGTAGTTSCSCDTGYQSQNGVCKKKIDQTCTATTECYSALGIVCSSGKCICDGNLHLTTPGTAGQVSCSCASGYFADSSGSCRAVIGTSCSDGAACIDNALCDPVSKTCKCDTSNNFAQGSSGDNTCSCSSGSVPRSDGKCGLKVGGTCSDVCVSNGVCTSGLCACQTNFYNQTDGSCSSGIAVVSSIFLLAATIFLTFIV